MGREKSVFWEGKNLMGTGNTKLGRKGQQRWERTKMSFPFTNETVQNLWPFPTMRASYFNLAAACKSLQSNTKPINEPPEVYCPRQS